jgi:hypothetical protein
LYPLQALVKGIELRFKYHFQGSRNTNRVDKVRTFFDSFFSLFLLSPLFLLTNPGSTFRPYTSPSVQIADVQPEWAFANILDQIYEHQSFIKEYLQPLTTKAGYDINVKVSLLYPSSYRLAKKSKRADNLSPNSLSSSSQSYFNSSNLEFHIY